MTPQDQPAAPSTPAPEDVTARGAYAPIVLPPPSVPLVRPAWPLRAAGAVWRWLGRVQRWCVSYVRDNDPRTITAWLPFFLVSLVVYTRHWDTNYIFDEQEALLGNPYVNAQKGLKFWDVIHVDFWGLPPDGSIGSYRPLPNVLWRAMWSLSKYFPAKIAHVPKHPFVHDFFNILFHSLNAALLAALAFALTRRRALGWLAGLAFLMSAVLTEAVSGIVGLADVLGGLGALLALHALRLPGAAMPFGVFAGVLVGLSAKESALVCVPLVPLAALVFAPLTHPGRPARAVRALLAGAAALGAFVLYVELRKQWFDSPLPEALRTPLPDDASALAHHFRDFMVWFHQPPLPKDPLNNPLVEADFLHRTAGALRVYWRGLVQTVLPLHLSGDYSFPQEPVPASLHEPETLAGAFMAIFPPLLALSLWLRAISWERYYRRRRPDALPAPQRAWPVRIAVAAVAAGIAALAVEDFLIRRTGDAAGVRTWPYAAAALAAGLGALCDVLPSIDRPVRAPGGWPWPVVAGTVVALGMVWVVVSYFPHSNIPVVLPTVRAERFWYFPVMGTSLILGALFAWLRERWPTQGKARLRVRFFRLFVVPVVVPPATALLILAFFGFQSVRAYLHAMDYRDDLAFWYATKEAVPKSAKAHLNYSVMIGARSNIAGHLETRLAESHIARKLAPEWAMAHIYTGDTLCRMQRAEEAWPYYASGFDLGPNDKGLISLALQCMYDEKILLKHGDEMRAIVDKHRSEGNTWLAYLVTDTLANYEKNKGVDPEYRPRGYNQAADDE